MSTASIGFDIFARDRASSTFDKVGRSAGQAEGKLQKFGRGAGLLKATVVGAFAAVGASAAVSFGIDVVKSASDANETLNKSNVIFGKNAKGIEKWASTAADKMGLSKTAAMASAASFGDMFLQLGFADSAAAKMSKSVVQMSADLGSFNNLPTEDVTQRISAAFRGEYDSLQALIPNINAARVETQALAMTGKDNAKELTAQEKAAAVLAIVNKDGARAMGDFSRTQDSAANVAKRVTASWEDMKSKIGQALLPMLTRLGQWFLSDGLPAIQRFGGWIKNSLWPALQRGYQTVLPGLRQALSILTGGVDGGSMSWKSFGKVITDKVIPWVSHFARYQLPFLAAQIRVMIEGIKAGWRAFITFKDKAVEMAVTVLRKFAGIASGWAVLLRALGKVPGFDWARRAADSMDRAAARARELANGIASLHSKTITVTTRFVGDTKRPWKPEERSSGGPMRKGVPYITHRDELVVPAEDKHVFNASQTRGILSGGETARLMARGGSSPSGGGGGVFAPVAIQVDGRTLMQALIHYDETTGGVLGVAGARG